VNIAVMKNNRAFLLMVVLLLPLLFINISTAHDWGDDFAAFIGQAKAILAGKNISKPDLCLISKSPI
jgi:hypothetical protein